MSAPPDPPGDLRVQVAPIDEVAPRTLYQLLRLRVDVFVVEQACAFGDLDGRDLEDGCRHLWLEDGQGQVAGYARLLDGPGDDSTIGRIVVPPEHRGTGTGAHLLREALALVPGTVHLKAQQRLADWYARFGFAVVGEPFDEDGIPHVPMRLDRP